MIIFILDTFVYLHYYSDDEPRFNFKNEKKIHFAEGTSMVSDVLLYNICYKISHILSWEHALYE